MALDIDLCTVLVTAFSAITLYLLLRPRQKPEMNGLNVVVTGASRGIGKEIALQYAREKCNLLLVARSEGLLSQVKSKCISCGASTVHIAPLDLSSEEAARELRRTAVDTLGTVDTLILNHALLPLMGKLGEWTGEERLERMELLNRVNYLSYVYIATFFLPLLQQTGGKIGIVNSFVADIPMFRTNAYSASKAAVGAFFSSVAQELAMVNSPVTISQVYLGVVATEYIMDDVGQRTKGNPTMHRITKKFLISSANASETIVHAVETRLPFTDNMILKLFKLWMAVSPATLLTLIRKTFVSSESVIERIF